MPTVLELMKIEKPGGMDGRSLLPILEGKTQTNRAHVFSHINMISHEKNFPSRCVRTKTRAYIFNAWADGQTEFTAESMSGLSFDAMNEAGKSDPRIKARVDQYIL